MGEAEGERTARQTGEILRHELPTTLCVVIGREQLLRKRVRRGDPSGPIAREFEAIEAALIRLTAALERLNAGE